MKNKRGQTGGLLSSLVSNTGNLILTVIIILVIVSTILGASLLTSGSAEENAAGNLSSNMTVGIANIATKIPTVFLIGAVVLILSVLAILVVVFKRMNVGGGSGGL